MNPRTAFTMAPRDNALGITAILEAAKFLSQNPVKRSVIILAFCGEDKGFAGKPVVC